MADVLEALMGLAEGRGLKRVRTGPRDAQMRTARVCYNHLAGAMGVQMYASMLKQGILAETGPDVVLTGEGASFVTRFGIDAAGFSKSRAPLCRSCLDWSERRSHLAGTLGRAMLVRMEETGWMRRIPGQRVIEVTGKGQNAFAQTFPTV